MFIFFSTSANLGDAFTLVLLRPLFHVLFFISSLHILPMRPHSHHLPGFFHITSPATLMVGAESMYTTRASPNKGLLLLLLDPRPSCHGQSSLVLQIVGTLRQCPYRRICHRSSQPQRHIGALDITQHDGISTASAVSQNSARKSVLSALPQARPSKPGSWTGHGQVIQAAPMLRLYHTTP